VLRAIEWILLGTASTRRSSSGCLAPAGADRAVAVAGRLGREPAIGDVFYALDCTSAAELCYLAMFVLVTLSLLLLTRGGSLVDRAGSIDLLAFTCSALLVVWVFIDRLDGRSGGSPRPT
jgi:hypothetical protein